MKKISLWCGLALSTALVLLTESAIAQVLPQAWVSVGGRDDETTYSVGARLLNVGLELGFGPDGATGVDALAFINLPLVNRISPYVGLGVYSEDTTIAVSGGVQVNPIGSLVLGGGYNSVRGVNGQIGVRF